MEDNCRLRVRCFRRACFNVFLCTFRGMKVIILFKVKKVSMFMWLYNCVSCIEFGKQEHPHPDRRITPRACKQFRIFLELVICHLNVFPKRQKMWFWTKGTKHGPRRAKISSIFKSNWPRSLRDCLEPANAATVLSVILQTGSSWCRTTVVLAD